MSILFNCPHCGKQTNVPDEFAGRSGPCAGCGKTITIAPGAGFVPMPPARSSGAPIAIVIGIVFLGVLVVLLCGGDKRSQDRDIRLAKQFWQEFKQSDL